MAGELPALARLVSTTGFSQARPEERVAIDQAMRAALLCTLIGVEREGWVWPYRADDARASARALAALFEPLKGIGHLATLAAAADLDPMDPGPSHTVLPATLAACVVAESEADVCAAVLAAVEAAWQVRRCVTARPGVGFHSAGVYGALAAAAAGARALRLDPQACANAMSISLTRAAGLAVNSAASMIGMTHFGWGALHGLESALLASEGWSASNDLERALSSIFGVGQVDLRTLAEPVHTGVARSLVFKRYPCNIYLNALVTLLQQCDHRPLDRIEIHMPWIPHLDCPAPRDMRQARNSAQAVAAIAGTGEATYAAFSGPPGPWVPPAPVAALLQRVELVADKSAATRLDQAVVRVRAWRGGVEVLDASQAMRALGGWGDDHARRLLGAPAAHPGIDAIYRGSIRDGFEYVSRLRLRPPASSSHPQQR
jgi:hypothetical protein